MNKKLLSLLFLLMFAFTIVSAVPPVTTVQQFTSGYNIVEAPSYILGLNQDYIYSIFVYNYSTGLALDNSSIICHFDLQNYSGGLITHGDMIYNLDGHWEFDIDGSNFSYIGYYPYGVSCQDGAGGVLSGIFEVTPSRQDPDSWPGQVIIFVFFILLLMSFIYLNLNINFDKWYSSILSKYINKNFFKTIISSVGFNIMNNGFALYYIIGFPLVIQLSNIIWVYNISPLMELADTFLWAYTWASILVAVSLIGKGQEFITNLVRNINRELWGTNNE